MVRNRPSPFQLSSLNLISQCRSQTPNKPISAELENMFHFGTVPLNIDLKIYIATVLHRVRFLIIIGHCFCIRDYFCRINKHD